MHKGFLDIVVEKNKKKARIAKLLHVMEEKMKDEYHKEDFKMERFKSKIAKP